jgi:hypothetical protein
MVIRTAAACIAALAITSAPALAQAPGPDVCAACHADYVATFNASMHGTKADRRTPAAGNACATCHGDPTEHVSKGGGRGVGGLRNLGSAGVSARPTGAANAAATSAAISRGLFDMVLAFSGVEV